MKVKELRKILKNLPANMEILVNSGLCSELDQNGLIQTYHYGLAPKKAKTKLVRISKGNQLIQSRPQRDSKAKLKLILE